MDKEPLVLLVAAAAPLDQDELALELLPVDIGVQLAAGHGRDRVVGLVGLPRAGVPHDDVAAAVLAVRDDALEVDVLDRVILDVDRQAPCLRVERRAVGHSPARQHPVHLEAQVVVPAAGAVPLHDEPQGLAAGLVSAGFGCWLRGARRLGSAGKVAFRLVGDQAVGGP